MCLALNCASPCAVNAHALDGSTDCTKYLQPETRRVPLCANRVSPARAADAVQLAARIVVTAPQPGKIERVIETEFGADDEYVNHSRKPRFNDLVEDLRQMFLCRTVPE